MVKSLFKKITSFITNFPWLVLLLGILITVAAGIIRPDYYLLGWDNFSSYLDVPLNIERTLISPWRESRGLGVASDSEVVDVFHQAFTGLFSFILPTQLLDQVYISFVFIVGALLMYLFAFKLFRYVFPPPADSASKSHHLILNKYADLFAFLAVIFYVFNLNTLSVFYFPMLPYTSRFLALPAVHLLLLLFFKNRVLSKKVVLSFIALTLMASVSYVTATIFITIIMSLFIHGLGYFRFKKLIVFLSLFIGLNMFWLLPFLNYTLQKSSVISLAPSNIEGNESLLNKSYEFFEPKKQLIFYSNFFEMNYINPDTNNTNNFHPLTSDFNSPIYHIFPVLYLLGLALITVFIYLNYRKNTKVLNLVWIPLHTLFFMFLSFKEFGPTGLFYKLLVDNIPLFQVVFRFGDAKFHPFVAFSASLLAAFGIIYLLYVLIPEFLSHFKIQKRVESLIFKFLPLIVVLFLLAITFWGFRSYFTRQFVGSFMYTQIPRAYFQMAENINKDPANVRVLHLPMDKYSYWRPYSWGYYGSSFFHFLINKPYLDKTFEPASLENNYINTKIYSQTEHLQNLKADDKRQAADDLAETLREANIKYLVLDETVGSTNIAQDKKYVTALSFEKSQIAVNLLKNYGLIREHSRYQVNPYEYKNYSNHKDQTKKTNQTIILYEVLKVNEKMDFATNIKRIDPKLDYLAQTSLFPTSNNQTWVQSTTGPGFELRPFLRKDAVVTQTKNEVIYTLPKDNFNSGSFSIKTDSNIRKDTRVVKLIGKKSGDVLIISLYEVMAPSIQDNNFDRLIGDAIIPLSTPENASIPLSNLRLRLDNIVLEVPANLSEQEQLIGYVLSTQDQPTMELLQRDQIIAIPGYTFKSGSPVDCLGTKLEGFQAYVEGLGDGVNIEGQNGSVCVISELGKMAPKELAYGELSLNISGRGTDLDPEFNELAHADACGSSCSFTPSNLQLSVVELNKPVNAYFCIERNGLPPCFNSDKFISIQGQKRIVLPIEKDLFDTSGLRFIFALRNVGYQKQQAIIDNIQLSTYKVANVYQVDLRLDEQFTQTVTLDNTKELTIRLPKTKSVYSSYNNAESYNLNLADQPCEDKKGYRSVRESDEKIVIYTRKCGSGLFFSYPDYRDLMYLWSVDYNLLSGQFPNMRVYDESGEYFSERASLYQGYPFIKDFKSADPGSKLTSKDFEKLNTHSAYYILHSDPVLRGDLGKAFALTQYSDNDGVVAIDSFNIVALPKHWSSLSIEANSGTTQSYNKPSNATIEKVIPGIWKVKIGSNSPNGKYLLEFKEGFDQQWNIYSSKGDIVINKSAGTNNRCNGLFNCFEIELTGQTRGEKTYYLFYEPIKLSILGAVISLIVGISLVGISILNRKK